MRTKQYWISVAERALKSAAQGLLVIWPVGDAALHLWDVDWKKALSGAAAMAGASVLTSLISAPIGPDNSPSLVGEPPKEPAAVLEPDPDDETVDGRHVLDDDPDDIPVSRFETPRTPRFDDPRNVQQ
jgi:hypothetical protein